MWRLALVVVEIESLKQCVLSLAWCYWDGVFPKLSHASVEFQLIQLITGSLYPVLGWIQLGCCLSKVKSLFIEFQLIQL